MRFIVYNATPLSGTTHTVLRWGDAPEGDIGIQAEAGEVAIPAPAAWPANPVSSESGGYSYNTATQAVTFFGIPYSEPYADKVARLVGEVREALRETEWSMLPDAWLDSAQSIEMKQWREWVRSIPAGGPGWADLTYNLTPPYSEF